jgi:polyisoprenoid-binding protein YceI
MFSSGIQLFAVASISDQTEDDMSITATEHLVPTGTWTVDATHSQVDFAVKHLGISAVRGTFADVSATLTGGDAPTLEGTIRLASVSTGDETRDVHLLSPDFFDADRFPEATFEATFVSRDRLVGDFTLRGVTKEIELTASFTTPVADPSGGDRLGLELEGEIDRTEYGVSFNMPLPTGGFALGEKVKLYASLSFVKAA